MIDCLKLNKLLRLEQIYESKETKNKLLMHKRKFFYLKFKVLNCVVNLKN